jgi:hypothetical protein
MCEDVSLGLWYRTHRLAKLKQTGLALDASTKQEARSLSSKTAIHCQSTEIVGRIEVVMVIVGCLRLN